jgi:hypothetical protein
MRVLLELEVESIQLLLNTIKVGDAYTLTDTKIVDHVVRDGEHYSSMCENYRRLINEQKEKPILMPRKTKRKSYHSVATLKVST